MMKRYWLVLVFESPGEHPRHIAIDRHPADWLAEKITYPRFKGGNLVIINQFEITAEQYTRMESLQ